MSCANCKETVLMHWQMVSPMPINVTPDTVFVDPKRLILCTNCGNLSLKK